MLPFFANHIAGLSVMEMAAPGVLFGDGAGDYGCWEWKAAYFDGYAYFAVFTKKRLPNFGC